MLENLILLIQECCCQDSQCCHERIVDRRCLAHPAAKPPNLRARARFPHGRWKTGTSVPDRAGPSASIIYALSHLPCHASEQAFTWTLSPILEAARMKILLIFVGHVCRLSRRVGAQMDPSSDPGLILAQCGATRLMAATANVCWSFRDVLLSTSGVVTVVGVRVRSRLTPGILGNPQTIREFARIRTSNFCTFLGLFCQSLRNGSL